MNENRRDLLDFYESHYYDLVVNELEEQTKLLAEKVLKTYPNDPTLNTSLAAYHAAKNIILKFVDKKRQLQDELKGNTEYD